MTVDGDLINRCELFDDADLDAALARFDELTRPAPQLENAASQVEERFQRLRGTRLGRDDGDTGRGCFPATIVDEWWTRASDTVETSLIANMRATADLGITNVTSTVIATRGERLVLSACPLLGPTTSGPRRSTPRCSASSRSTPTSGSWHVVAFDLDDIDAAFEELDARYLAGEAAAHAHTWSVFARANAALNRHELPRDDTGLGQHRPSAR